VLHSFHGGIAVLPERLAARLGERLLTSRPVESVKRDDHGWWIDAAGRSWGPFDAVIDATPAHAAAHHQPDPEVRRRLAEIRFAPLTVVAVAYPRAAVPHPLDGFGLLIPSREQRRLLGVLWTSSIFSGRVPAGQVLLRCMFGGGKALERTDDELLARLATELREILGVASRPSRRWIFRHPRGIAQYEPGHLARLRGLEDRLAATPGLFLAGSSYRGISINLCVRDAERTARTVRKFLRGAGRPPRVT
jgi:oxygen-dependent protoporphyrinogen oxidase